MLVHIDISRNCAINEDGSIDPWLDSIQRKINVDKGEFVLLNFIISIE
jgi:hypothetical protein